VRGKARERAVKLSRVRRSSRTWSVVWWTRLVIGGVAVYVAIDVALVFLRPEFSVLHNAESDYGSNGHYAWLMDINFVLRAAFSLAAVRAISLAVGANSSIRVPRILLVAWAVLSGALAFFPDDPVGTESHGVGAVHDVLAFIAFLAVLFGALAFSLAVRRQWQPGWRSLVAISVIAFIPLLLLGHAQFGLHTLGAVYEKLFIATELIWLATASVHAARIDSTVSATRFT
jgi:hypothetical protein